ncbi:MAG: hypothetical protein HYS38_07445 [Acidobacteria bacterium]|nr:hypothetical protein [Acidobacteriota bacterium]
MKYFFRKKVPLAHDVLFIESGSPEVTRRVLEGIRQIFPDARYHLLTCWPDAPSVRFDTVFRASEYPSGWSKLRLLLTIRRKGWEVMAILCTGERILWRWKMLALALIPANVLVVNENADFFWLHWGNWRTLRQLLAVRWAANLGGLFWTALRALAFPFTLLFLLFIAAFLYTRRWWRLAIRKFYARPSRNPQSPEAASLCEETPQWKTRS